MSAGHQKPKIYQEKEFISTVNETYPLDKINDGGERISYGETAAIREPTSGKGRYDLITPFGIDRLAKWYELGAQKYADRNWEKGMPFSRYLDSVKRHLNKYAMGMTDEDHLAAACWNIMAIMHHQELGELQWDDMPHYLKEKAALKYLEREMCKALKIPEYVIDYRKDTEMSSLNSSFTKATTISSDLLKTGYYNTVVGTGVAPVNIHIKKEEFFKDYKVPGDFIYLDKEGNLKQVAIKEALYSDPATVIFWDDGTRTVCKAFETDSYNPESGLVMCIIKKLYGGSNLKKILETWIPKQMQFKGTATRVTMKDARKNMKK